MFRTAPCFALTNGPRFTAIVQSLPSIVPFVAPEESERVRGRPFAVRLGANENTFGPSPKAVSAMQASVTEVWKYGDPKSHELRNALAARNSIDPANLVVGEGVDGILAYAAHLLIGPGDAVVTSLGSYPTLNYFVAGRGGTMHTVPYSSNDQQDVDALLAKAREVDAKIIYFVNPDNPSGSWHSAAKVEAMIAEVPPGCLLLLDEAYLELMPEEAVPTVAADDPRVIRLRTFSKAYGLAGARIGYAIGAPETIGAFDKIRNHFGIGRISQIGALAALEDESYLQSVQEQVAASRNTLADIAVTNGLVPLPSATNFVTIDCGCDAAFARKVLAELLDRDIFVRMPATPPLDRCIRVSCAGPADMELFRAALPLALSAAKA
jgi:histidinol-phosphate aminotransferase